METRPSVCVLLSTYDGEAFLAAQLESLSAQRGVAVRLHARDDGSTDGTLAILHRYAKTWPELEGLQPGPNLGPGRSFLELLRTAPDADHYAFCDQDDVWLPGKLLRAVEALSGEQGPALYCSNVTCVAEDLTVLGVPRENGDTRLQHLLFENIAYGYTTVMNRAARTLIAKQMPEQGLVMHDWWCALVISALGDIRYDAESQILYRQHRGNSIGTRMGPLNRLAGQTRIFLRNPLEYYAPYGQAAAFLRQFRAELTVSDLALVESFVQSRATLFGRLGYAMSGRVHRLRPIDALVVRGLIAMGWY